MGKSFSKLAVFQHSMADYKDIKNKLNSIFEKIVTKAGVDLSNPEIKDIQSAVSEMLERIKTRINERGVFSISRTELCGSMAEKTAIWKYDEDSAQPFIEFDFLAVLQAAFDVKPDCQECFCVNTLPANLELLEKYYRSLYESYFKDGYRTKTILEVCFTRETTDCLSSCRCLEVKYYDRVGWGGCTFEPSSTSSETQQCCKKCTVDRPTGTLRVKTSEKIGKLSRNRFSLKFDWISKAKTCTRDSGCLPETEKMDNFTIHIDFLPALELFQAKQQCADVAACSSSDLVLSPTSCEYEHYCFLVPKHCVFCNYYDKWRRSGCRAEIDTIVNKMSVKHRKCYQVLKHLTGLFRYLFNTYHLKIAVLRHNNSCSDAGEDCAKCVFKVLDELQQAYKTKELLSLRSQANLLEQVGSDQCNCISNRIYRFKKVMCSAVPELDSVSSFIDEVKNEFNRP